MRITLGELRAEIRRQICEGSWQVTFTEKNGTPGKPRIFGAEKLAQAYARTVKNGKVLPADEAAPAVAVQQMPAAGLDDLKAASKKYYDKHWNPRKNNNSAASSDYDAAENAYEREAEMWANARAAGQSAKDTYKDIDFERSRRRR